MVVGMQLQQKQPHASPATGLKDASIPCSASPLPAPKSQTVSSADETSAPKMSPVIKEEPLLVPKAKVTNFKSVLNALELTPMNEAAVKRLKMRGSSSSLSRSSGRITLREVNPYLVCVLCQGYFVDATSITECLHSFCRSCIMLHLSTKNCCPKCEVTINSSKPHLSLKPDKALQDIVYKLVPRLFQSEMERRRQFYQAHPNRDLDLHPEYRGETVDRYVYSPEDQICVALVYDDRSKEREEPSRVPVGTSSTNSDSDGDDSSPRRYFMCPAALRIMDLKKLIRMKFSLGEEHEVEFLFRQEVLQDDYALMDIAYFYTWKRNSPMQLYYHISTMTTVPVQSPKLKVTRKTTMKSTSCPLTPTLDISDSDSSQRPSAVTVTSDSGKCSQTKSTDSAESPKLFERLSQEVNSSVTKKSSAPTQTLPAPLVGSGVPASEDKSSLSSSSSQDKDKKPNDAIIQTKASAKSQLEMAPSTVNPKSPVTNMVHSTPKVLLKSSIGTPEALDERKCADKSSVKCKSYLAISSIMNENDKQDEALSSSGLMKLSKSSTNPSCSSPKVPVTSTSPKSTKSLSSIVQSLTTTACPVPGLENHKPLENNKCTDVLNGSATRREVSSPKTETSSAKSSPIVTDTSKNTTTMTTPITSHLPILQPSQMRTLSTKQSQTTVTIATKVQVSSKSISQSVTPIIPGNNTRVKPLPKLLPAVGKSGPPDFTPVVVSPSANKQPMMRNGPTRTCFPSSLGSSPVLANALVLPSSTKKQLMVKNGLAQTRCPTPLGSSPAPTSTVQKTIHPSSNGPSAITKAMMPPLLTMNTAVHANSFIQPKNAKIPSSVEISLTQANRSKASPSSNSKKVVRQNFRPHSNMTAGFQSVSGAVKRSAQNSRDDGPKEKYMAVVNKIVEKDDQQPSKLQLQKNIPGAPTNGTSGTTNKNTSPKKVFSSDILPEVSITRNLNPEAGNKRLALETSYDVSCFKPLGVSNGIPALTPINMHSVTQNNMADAKPAGNNVVKSPSKRPFTFMPKSSELCSGTPVSDEDMKKQNDVSKRIHVGICARKAVRLNARSPSGTEKALPGCNKTTTTSAKTDGGASSAAIPLKKDGAGRHQGIPQLIDINAPFAKSRLQLVSAKPNSSTPKLHPADSVAAKANTGTPDFNPPDLMTTNVLRQQEWMFNMSCPIPPHPLMNSLVAGQTSTIPANTPKK